MGKKKQAYQEPSKIKRFFNIVMYILLGLILFFQVIGLIGVSMSEVTAIKESKSLIPSWIGAVYLIAMAVVLCKAWKKKEKLSLIPLVLGMVGAVLALVVSLTLRAALPLQAAATNVSLSGLQGLNGWRLFWRHYSLILVGVITAVVSFIHYKRLRNERIRKENESYQEHFNFETDAPLFADEEKEKDKKLSKKERKAQKKA